MVQLPDVEVIEGTIHVVRGQRVMLDADLARLYGVQTERLNQQVRRNQEDSRSTSRSGSVRRNGRGCTCNLQVRGSAPGDLIVSPSPSRSMDA